MLVLSPHGRVWVSHPVLPGSTSYKSGASYFVCHFLLSFQHPSPALLGKRLLVAPPISILPFFCGLEVIEAGGSGHPAKDYISQTSLQLCVAMWLDHYQWDVSQSHALKKRSGLCPPSHLILPSQCLECGRGLKAEILILPRGRNPGKEMQNNSRKNFVLWRLWSYSILPQWFLLSPHMPPLHHQLLNSPEVQQGNLNI